MGASLTVPTLLHSLFLQPQVKVSVATPLPFHSKGRCKVVVPTDATLQPLIIIIFFLPQVIYIYIFIYFFFLCVLIERTVSILFVYLYYSWPFQYHAPFPTIVWDGDGRAKLWKCWGREGNRKRTNRLIVTLSVMHWLLLSLFFSIPGGCRNPEVHLD